MVCRNSLARQFFDTTDTGNTSRKTISVRLCSQAEELISRFKAGVKRSEENPFVGSLRLGATLAKKLC